MPPKKRQQKKGKKADDDVSSVSSASIGEIEAEAENHIAWENSNARELILQAFENGEIELEYAALWKQKGPRKVYDKLLELGMVGIDYNAKFTNHLRDLRDMAVASSDRAKNDEEAYNNFIALHPRPTHDHKGFPRWEGSAAEQLLKEDMDKELHKGKKPKEFYETRDECQVYSLEKFRAHVDQEKRLRNHLNFLEQEEEERKANLKKSRAAAAAKAKKAIEKRKKEKKKKARQQRR